ncbi:MAG: hypothetical protein AAFQ80_09225, partial [Cyanobacteria bacterium J06621_8]
MSFYKYTVSGNGEIPAAPILKIEVLSLDKNNFKTTLGETGSLIGAKLAFYFADKDLATQLVSEATGKTLGGFLADQIEYQRFERYLPARALYGRFVNDFRESSVELINSSISQALNEALDIEDPLTQIFVQNVTTSLTEAIAYNLTFDVFDIDEDTAIKYLGFKEGDKFLLAFDSIIEETFERTWKGFPNFVLGQLFNYLDEVWTDVSLSNIGSTFGGIIGNFILPGIGTLVGQIAGGFVWDLIDNPEAFYSVTLNSETGAFEFQFAFEDDDGEVAIAEQMSQTASETLNLLVGIIGGTPIAADSYLYGLKEDQFQHRNQEINSFDDFESAITVGIVSQIKTVEFEGGDEYIKYLLAQPDYNPSLDVLFEDLGVAQEYSNHKSDPFLYGKTILNIEDEEAKNYLLQDWERVRTKARELGLYDAPFNDGGEFISDTDGNDRIDGDIGNDFLYSGSGIDTLSGGDGDDTIQASLSVAGSLFFGGDGEDSLVVDFSDYNPDDFASGSTNEGLTINHSPNAFGREYISDSEGTLIFSYGDIERINAIGTAFNDRFETDSDRSIVDAGEGLDELYLDWRNATSDIEIDLTVSEDQAIYGGTQLSNFEIVDFIITGSGNDQIKLDYSVLKDGYISGELDLIDGGEGEDTLIWDFSDYNPDDFAGSDAAEGLTINYFPNAFGREYISDSEGTLIFSYGDIERINAIGTAFNDRFETDSDRSIVDAGEGLDELYLDWRNATSDIEIDLTVSEDQAVYGGTQLSNFEIVDFIITGSGNDQIKLDYSVLKDGYTSGDFDIVDGGEGEDTLIWDFSD